MSMFGLEKFKEYAKKGTEKVANLKLNLNRKVSESEEEEDLEQLMIQENKKLKSLVKQFIALLFL